MKRASRLYWLMLVTALSRPLMAIFYFLLESMRITD